MVLCLYSEDGFQLKRTVASFANKLYQTLSEQYQISFEIGISTIRKGLPSVSLSYMESFNKDAFFLKAGTSKHHVKNNTFHYNDYNSIFSYEERIVALLLADNFKEARNTLSSLQAEIHELDPPFDDIRLFCRNILYSYMHSLTESGIPKETFHAYDLSTLFNCTDQAEMFETLYTLLRDISEHTTLLQCKNIGRLMIKAKQYIAAHYCDPCLSMPEVADYVGLNPSYFSAEFTKHEKQCFINYLTHLRITQSKHLLIRTDDKIQAVSEAVGYINATYYSTIFKRIVGMTPTQYRKHQEGDIIESSNRIENGRNQTGDG